MAAGTQFDFGNARLASMSKQPRIGIFVCHCGINIGGVVKVPEVVERVRALPGVVAARDYQYCCSDPGQNIIRETIEKEGLSRVVVACCSPTLHEKTFRKACAAAGINPYMCEVANIREQCSWVTKDRDQATDKAFDIIAMTVARVANSEPLVAAGVPVTKRALVVGAGLAGIQAALDIANAGYETVLVEKEPTIGGHVARLASVFPNFDKAQEMLDAKSREVCGLRRVKLLTRSEVVEVSGQIGNFKVRIRRKPTQAQGSVPDSPDDGGQETEELVGAIVMATGHELMPVSRLRQYGGGQVPDVIDALQFERLLAGNGTVRRPSDGRVPKRVVFVQCAGSRDKEHGVPYCSKVCCMYAAKQAMLYKRRVPDGDAVVCYIDVRTPGKGSEEFYRQATQEGVRYVRGKVSKIFRSGDRCTVWSADTLAGCKVVLEADLVVLAMAMVPNPAGVSLARQLKLQLDANGFLTEAHPKLRPVETLTGGFFLAGTCQGPKDILETTVQASAASAKVLAILGQDELLREPTVACVDEDVCVGCGNCELTCAYSAVTIDPQRRKAVVNVALCEGCGACAVACPSGAMSHKNFSKKSVYEMVDQL